MVIIDGNIHVRIKCGQEGGLQHIQILQWIGQWTELLWEADICLLAPSVNIECEIQEGHWTPCALFFSSSTNFCKKKKKKYFVEKTHPEHGSKPPCTDKHIHTGNTVLYGSHLIGRQKPVSDVSVRCKCQKLFVSIRCKCQMQVLKPMSVSDVSVICKCQM